MSLRKEYIEKVLCIERAKPMSTCKGSCYLFKRLKASSPQQQEKGQIVNGKLNISFFYEMTVKLCFQINGSYLQENPFPNLNDDLPNSYLDEIFHPPQFIS